MISPTTNLIGDLGHLAKVILADPDNILPDHFKHRRGPFKRIDGTPTMMVREAALAPACPPETGASR